MGTRADFYVGRGKNADWLGSIAWDGYPSAIPPPIKNAANTKEFRYLVKGFIFKREDGTFPKEGWPWPWDNSNSTDYSYAFDNGVVYVCCFGTKWYNIAEYDPDKEDDENNNKDCIFPDMSKKKNVTFGKRSGVIIIESR
jgi:hypothetical protein